MNVWTGFGIFLLGAGIGALVSRIATQGQLRQIKAEIMGERTGSDSPSSPASLTQERFSLHNQPDTGTVSLHNKRERPGDFVTHKPKNLPAIFELMQNNQCTNNQCTCTAVFCGHAFGEHCPNEESVRLTIAVRTETSDLGQAQEIGLCQSCWENFKKYMPGLFYSRLPVSQAS